MTKHDNRVWVLRALLSMDQTKFRTYLCQMQEPLHKFRDKLRQVHICTRSE